MAILSKVCKADNFESHNSLKLSFMNIRGLRSNFVDRESFLESNSPDILALCEIEYFPLTYDLSSFKSRINISFNCRFLLNRFPACFNLFVLLFLVTPCLVVAVQPCME